MTGHHTASLGGMALLAIVLTISPAFFSQAASEGGQEEDKTMQSGEAVSTTVHWRYGLSAVIAMLTGVGSIILIRRTFPSESRTDSRRLEGMLGLYMIAVALIVEAVLICCILEVDVKQYEAIYAAIAGYVLGSLPRRQDRLEGAPPRQENSTSA